jgi:tetratricopeptide (TPR) repeat protein
MVEVLNMSLDLDPESIINEAIDIAVSRLETQPKVAELLLRQTLKIDPDHPRALSLLGLALFRLGQHLESLVCFEKSIVHNIEDTDALNNMSLVYASLEEYEKSAECLEKALLIKPDQYLFLNNLALQYKQMGDLDRAYRCFKSALDLCQSPMVWCNLGGLYVDNKIWDDAYLCYLKAIYIDKSLAAPHVFISYVYGHLGYWEEAFEEYEWRFNHFDQLKHYKKAYDSEKKWRGEDLEGKTIILYGEQGWGDQIQYVRYVEQVKLKGANTIVHCSQPLQELFGKLPWIDEVICHDTKAMTTDILPKHDFHCSLMSLPLLLKDFKPSGTAYIKTSSILDIKGLEEYKGELAVGIAWAGSPSHPNDPWRSMYLQEFEPLQMDGVRLFNLQVGSSKRFYPGSNKTIDFALGGHKVRLVDLTPLMGSYDVTASVISGLDLIISVDTSIVHLAGAMGIPCWVLLPYNSDWRWGISGDRTDWYDSLRLFRQETPKDWGSVMKIVKRELEHLNK